jgi:rfaE bifunctional protein kinase chain/domain
MALKIKTIARPDPARLDYILDRLDQVRAAVAGDLALDAYWQADMTRSELSLETPHYPLPVVEERYAPGAGGNVAANLAALDLASVMVTGVIGRDWRGQILLEELAGRGIDTSALASSPGWLTNAYIKPYRRGVSDLEYEDPRLDFASHSPLPEQLEQDFAKKLLRLAGRLDVLCLSDQFQNGCLGERSLAAVSSLAKAGLPVIADSRYRIGQFQGCLLKPNAAECARALGLAEPAESVGLIHLAGLASGLAQKTGSPVCLTAGDKGCLLAEPGLEKISHVPAFPARPPLDICGAGDSFLAVFSASIGAGATKEEAACLANAAAAVTVRKIKQTGTASRAEIKAVLAGDRHG